MEQYCLLAKGARGLALADLIQRVTSDPQIFAYGELLSMPHIQEVIARSRVHSQLCVDGNSSSATHHLTAFKVEDAPSVCVQLEKSEQASSLALLRLFSTGVWQDYTGYLGQYLCT